MEERDPRTPLTSFERTVLRLCEAANENAWAKSALAAYQRQFGLRLVRRLTENLIHAEGVDAARALTPDRGVLLCANHRSFFDLFVVASLLYGTAPWAQRMSFPVRANYFYESVGGLLINALISGFAMYPPIFRDAKKAEWNKIALEKIADTLAEPGALVGMHPEGTRGKGPDPYELL